MPYTIDDRKSLDRTLLIKMMIAKKKTLAEMAKVLGVTGERVRQIAANNGWKTVGVKGRPRKTTIVHAICKRGTCRKPFSYTKPQSRVYCSPECKNILIALGIGCWKCKKKKEDLPDDSLMKAGTLDNGVQKWMCHGCANERYKKHGSYNTPESTKKATLKWRSKNKERVLAISRKYYHGHKCKCPEHMAARAQK